MPGKLIAWQTIIHAWQVLWPKLHGHFTPATHDFADYDLYETRLFYSFQSIRRYHLFAPTQTRNCILTYNFNR